MEERLDGVFLNEAFDLLSDLEAASLTLELRPDDDKAIAKVFRVMHTLKGSSNMFGYVAIGALTHKLEHIYDLIRNNQKPLSDKILNITFGSIDLIRKLLTDKECRKKDNKAALKDIEANITKELGEVLTDEQKNDAIAEASISKNLKSYYILFRPGADILQFGNNPVFILEDIMSLGKCKITMHTKLVPSLENIEVDNCYVYWEIHLASAEPEDAIRGAFIFVEDLAHIEIYKVADQDLLANEDFVATIKKKEDRQEDIVVAELQTYVNQLLQIIREQNVKEIKSKDDDERSRISSLRIDSKKLDSLMNLVSELVTTQARLSTLANNTDAGSLSGIAENIEKISRQLRDTTFSMRLIPLQSIETRFQRLIRDLSKSLGKKVDFNTSGMDTELDKSIIERLTDPLLHILRNCLDHGVELPADRTAKGKPETGNIHLRSFYSGANVHIEIEDDGKGIDPGAVRQKAVNAGILEENAQMSNHEIFKLIFHPGLSTAKEVSEISGRGVGMNVVKENVEKLRGDIEINSHPGKGTIITISLPLTLSIIDGLMVEVRGQVYLLPQASVSRIHAAKYADLVEKYNDFFTEGNRQIPFIDLVDVFNNNGSERPEIVHVIETSWQRQDMGIVVEKVLGEKQVVLKPLGKYYSDMDQFSGATILGDGSVALVIDTNKMVTNFVTEKNLN